MAKDGNHSDVSLETFSKVVEAIYDCALDPSHWYRTIDMIADLCGCHYGLLGVIDLENVGNELRFHVGHKKHYLRLYEEKYAAINPYVGTFSLAPVGSVVSSASLLTKRELGESKYYREFLRPQGIRDAIGFNVLKTQRRIGPLSLHHLETQGPFQEIEIRLLTLLAPHVCRSVAVSDALNLKAVHADTLEATLDALTSGVYLTDREGRVVYMNHTAEHQAKTSNALRVANNRLAAVDYTARAALTKAIAEATADEVEPRTGGITIALPAGEDVGLVATALPLNRGERQNIGGRPPSSCKTRSSHHRFQARRSPSSMA